MGEFADALRAREQSLVKQPDSAPTPAPLETDQPSMRSVVRGEEENVSFAERLRQREHLQQAGIHEPHPKAADRANRNEALRAELINRGFEADHLGQPGLTDFGARFDLGLSDTFSEKREKFFNKFPEGDFVEVPDPEGGSTIMFRRSKGEPFAEIDARVLDRFELIGDLADLSGDIPSAAAEIAIMGGAGIVAQVLRVMGGHVIGEGIKEIVEAIRGYQHETLKEHGKRIGATTVLSGTGALATTVITGPLNFARGVPLFPVLPGAREAQKAAGFLQVPRLIPSQISASPMLQRLASQSQATVATIGQYLRKQQQAAVDALGRLNDRDALRFVSPKDIGSLHDEAVTQILGAANAERTSLTEAGDALKAGIVEYEDLSSAIVDRAYATARNVGTPEFDIKSALAVARDIRAGTLAKGKPQTVESNLLDADGKPIMMTVPGDNIQLQEVAPSILREINKLESIDPKLPPVTMPDGTVITATDQLRAIRSNLWSLKQVGIAASPEERRTAAQAEKLYAALTHVLKNPKNKDPAFNEAWAQANAEAAKRFDTLEKLIIVHASRTETPAQFAARMAEPLQVDNLKMLKATVSPERYAEFQAGVKSYFLDPQNLDNLSRNLAKFDKETLDLLLPASEQQALRSIGSQIDQLNQVGIKDAIRQQDNARSVISQLTQREDSAGLMEFVRRIEALKPSDRRRKAVRAAIIRDVFDDVVTVTRNGPNVNGKKLVAHINRLQETGLDNVLTAKDRIVIGRFKDLGHFLKVTEDVGTSMQASTTTAQVRKGKWEGFRSVLEALGSGRALISPLMQRILTGTGKDRLPFHKTRVIGAVLAQEIDSLKLEGYLGEPE